LTAGADEDDEAFYKRRNHYEEDAYVGKKIIDGIPEYTEFGTARPAEEGDRDPLQLLINRIVLRLCILRVFRPDLIEDTMRRFIELFLDASCTQLPSFNYLDVMKQADPMSPTILMRDPGVDAQAELLRMQKVVKKECQLHYLALTPAVLPQVPALLAFAAQSGHWVLLDNLENVREYMPELQRLFSQLYNYQREEGLRAQRSRQRADRDEAEGEDLNEEMRAELARLDKEAAAKEADIGLQKSSGVDLGMPDVQGFYLSSAFRLWVSTPLTGSSSAAFQQSCAKVMLEPLQGLKLNCTKVFNSTAPELVAACPEFADVYQLTYFVLTFLHSVYVLRSKFQALGWNAPYQFSAADHQLASLLNLSLAKELKGDETKALSQLKTLQYYTSEIIYGSKIFHE